MVHIVLIVTYRIIYLNGITVYTNNDIKSVVPVYRTSKQHLDALCYEGCEGHGSANGLPQTRMELAERSHEQTIWAGIVDGAKLFKPFS